MLTADAKRFENLASAEESIRVDAAMALNKLKRFHFDDHPVDKARLSPDKVAALITAWRETQSDLVRAWIAQVLVLTNSHSKDVFAIVRDSMNLGCRHAPEMFSYLFQCSESIPDGAEMIKAFHLHPIAGVRSRCAYQLYSMALQGRLDYASDIGMVRRLMLDTDPHARFDAVMTANTFFTELGPEDFEVLLDVVNMDSTAARNYSTELMKAMSTERPGCEPSAFAIRLPKLRSDGLYKVEKRELNAAGIWVSSRCLRFFPDGEVQCFDTNVAPVDFSDVLPHQKLEISRAVVHTKDGQVSFSIEFAGSSVDYQGEIDGDLIKLESLDHRTGERSSEVYRYAFIDWDAKQPVSAELDAMKAWKTRASKLKLPFECLEPESMKAVDACKWYVQMMARLPGMLEDIESDAEKLSTAWHLKSEMRKAAVKSMYASTLTAEFYAKLPLPDVDALRMQASNLARGKSANAAALRILLTVTLEEVHAFPGTAAEKYWDGKQTFVMTAEGWVLK